MVDGPIPRISLEHVLRMTCPAVWYGVLAQGIVCARQDRFGLPVGEQGSYAFINVKVIPSGAKRDARTHTRARVYILTCSSIYLHVRTLRYGCAHLDVHPCACVCLCTNNTQMHSWLCVCEYPAYRIAKRINQRKTLPWTYTEQSHVNTSNGRPLKAEVVYHVPFVFIHPPPHTHTPNYT